MNLREWSCHDWRDKLVPTEPPPFDATEYYATAITAWVVDFERRNHGRVISERFLVEVQCELAEWLNLLEFHNRVRRGIASWKDVAASHVQWGPSGFPAGGFPDLHINVHGLSRRLAAYWMGAR